MINVKPGVVFKVFTEEIEHVLAVVRKTWKRYAPGVVPTITSANDGKHGMNSKHYSDSALDLRSKNLTEQQKDEIFLALHSELYRRGFDVLLEARGTDNEHFHVEVDPKPGRSFA
jgi:hypothetical protein